MNISDLEKELSHKKRSVSDLISYIKTRNSNTPNYSVLLGAGASISSGIKSGYELCEEWRKDIYELLSKDKYESRSKAVDYLIRSEGGWYNEGNEYSSLFEKKFDLPAQRRRFVENEVDKAIPSIGYAYLTSLADESDRYIDTIFTTNFDDLCNEAFYQFSNIRPIVCAHDSSIHSLSITSSRPKIIKLHGDYLFDDIKSTLRETESLENNIKDKLIEFSREYGMIVVGYAGNDRSIMDVLNYLLSSETYLKNGLYWCIRTGDEVRPEVRKLLWKDKVYFVEIDGFDELMAEIHHNVKNDLPVLGNFSESKQDKIINNFIKDDYNLKEKSIYISSDVSKIRKNKDDFDISNLIMDLNNSNEDYLRGVSESQFKSLLKVDSLIKKKNYLEARKEADGTLNLLDDEDVSVSFLRRLVYICRELSLKDKALEYCNRLIAFDEYNFKYVLLKSENIYPLTDSCKFLYDNLERFDTNYLYINQMVSKAIMDIKNNSKRAFLNNEEVQRLIEKSLKLEPSPSNSAWSLYIDYIEYVYENSLNSKELNEKNKKIKDHLDRMSDMNSKNINYLRLNVENYSLSSPSSIESGDTLESLLDVVKSEFHKASKSKKELLFKIICDGYLKYFSMESKDVVGFFHDRYEIVYSFLNDKDFNSFGEKKNTASYFILKSFKSIQLDDRESYKESIQEAMKIEDSYMYCNRVISSLLNFLNDIEMAREYLEKVKEDIADYKYYQYLSNILLHEGDLKESLNKLDKSFEIGLEYDDYLTAKSYVYLRSEKYKDVISLYKSEGGEVRSETTKAVLLLNSELAKKMIGEKLDDLKIRNIISKKLGVNYIISAHCILGEKNQAVNLLRKEIDAFKLNYYSFLEWPIIPNEYLKEALTRKQNVKKVS